MQTSSEGIRFIKAFEGFSSHPYQCQAEVWTIGYGHTQGIMPWTPSITEREACNILKQDLIKCENAVNRLISIPLKQGEFDALVSFAFNLGTGALQRSTLRMRLNRGDRNIGSEFVKWINADGKKSAGLLRRRIAESDMFLRG